MINNVSRYPTARALWDGLALTYGSKGDSLQVFDLHRRANNIRQGDGSLEDCWNSLQDLWVSIDSLDTNPMICQADISSYNQKLQEFRLFQFLTAVSDRFETEKKELLKRTPLPNVEAAFSEFKRAETQAGLVKHNPSETGSSLGVGQGLAVKPPAGRGRGRGQPTDRNQQGQGSTPSRNPSPRVDKYGLICEHCGKKGHNRERCFQILGYPEWWEGKRITTSHGKSAAARTPAGEGVSSSTEDESQNGREQEESTTQQNAKGNAAAGMGLGTNPSPKILFKHNITHKPPGNLHPVPPHFICVPNAPPIFNNSLSNPPDPIFSPPAPGFL